MENRNAADFPDGVAVVTGGSGGIGRETCLALAQAGSDVALTWRSNRDAAEAVAREIADIGAEASIYQYDATDPASATRLATEASSDHGTIHTLVNAAGASIPMAYIGQVDQQTWDDVIESDVNGFFRLIQAFLPLLRQSRGSIVAVSSAGLQRFPVKDILSVAPKQAVQALIQGIAREEGRNGVRANSVGVGVVEAGMFLKLREEQLDDTWQQAAIQNTPLRRFGSGQEVADAVVFLASARASYITGQFLCVDGGYSI